MKTTSSVLDRQARRQEATAQYMRGEISLERFKEIERKNAPQYAEGVRLLARSIKQSSRKPLASKAK